MKHRVWRFCRVADGQNSDANTILEQQKEQLEQFCAGNDLTVAGISMVAGKSEAELRELARNGIEQDSFDMIAAVSVSRFSRNPQEIIQIAADLALCGKCMCMLKEGITNMPGFSFEKEHQLDDEPLEMGGQSL